MTTHTEEIMETEVTEDRDGKWHVFKTCEKCGSPDPMLLYKEADDGKWKWRRDDWPKEEFFIVTCRRCSYSWYETRSEVPVVTAWKSAMYHDWSWLKEAGLLDSD